MYLRDIEYGYNIPANLKQTFENKFMLTISQNQIVKMKNANVLTDRDLAIAKFLFQFKFATKEQLYTFLGEDLKKISLKNRLDKLVQYRVLNKFMLGEFEYDKIEKDALEIYCLDLGGRYLLSNYSSLDTNDWYTTVNMKTSELISINLLSVEFFLKLLEAIPEKIDYFKVEPEYRVGKKTLIPAFELAINENGRQVFFIGEVFRGWNTFIDVRERIEKLDSVLSTNAWKKYFIGNSPPILLLFTENDDDATKLGMAFVSMSENINFRITTDNRLSGHIGEKGSFLKFDIEDEKMTGKEVRIINFVSKD
jgi:hypothetical protein